MKKVDSDALGVVNRALGLSGTGSPLTEFADGIVDQSLEVGPIVRRGRTLAGTEGNVIFRLRNGHTDAQAITTIINPFAVVAGEIAPYPEFLSNKFDLWLLSASLRRTAGGGTLSAALFVNLPAAIIGISVQGSSALVAGITSHALAHWDAIISENIDFGITDTGGPWAKIGMRLPRAPTTQIVFASTSSLTSSYDLLLNMGVFPIALGQDGIV